MASSDSPQLTVRSGTSGPVAAVAPPGRYLGAVSHPPPRWTWGTGWSRWAATTVFLTVGVLAADRPAAVSPASGGSGEVLGWSLPYRQPDGTLIAKLSGAGARPLADGAFAIRDLKVELFTRSGETRALLTTAACTVRDGGKEISSPEPLRLQQGDGRGHLEGTGFYLNLATHQFIVSNRLQALVPFRLPQRPSP